MLRRAFGSRVYNNGPEALNENEANSGEQPGPAAVQEKQDIQNEGGDRDLQIPTDPLDADLLSGVATPVSQQSIRPQPQQDLFGQPRRVDSKLLQAHPANNNNNLQESNKAPSRLSNQSSSQNPSHSKKKSILIRDDEEDDDDNASEE